MATAAQLVKWVRDAIQHFDQSPYRSGFADDVFLTPSDANNTSILDWINKAQQELMEPEYAFQTFELDTQPGVAEYQLDPNIHEIRRVSLFGSPLDSATVGGQDVLYPGWSNYTPGNVGAAPVPSDALIVPQPFSVNPVAVPGGSPALQAQPQRYYTLGDRIGFDPAPDLIYPILIVAEFACPDLVLETDVPQHLPLRYHRALVSRAAWWISSFDIENPAAQARMPGLDADWQKAYQDLQRMVQERTDTENDQLNAGDYRYYFRRNGF